MSLTLQFVPYVQIADLGSARRVKKLLDLVKQDKIVLLEGRLEKQEETDLIEITMEEIDDAFTGIELAVINPDADSDSALDRLRSSVANVLLGNRTGMTIIGPANIVSEIKQNPTKIELMMKESKKPATRKRKTRKR